METSEPKKDAAPEPSGPSPAWTAFWIMAGLVAAWLRFGGYVVGIGMGALDPLAMLIFSVPCALLISRERERHGKGVTPRTLTCLAVFMAILVFILSRPFVGFGDTSDVRVFVTVSDQETGEPVEGASVSLNLAARRSASITDERGVAMLEFKQWTWTYHSWLLSWRNFDPGPVMVKARAASYLGSTRTINKRVEYRIHLINDSFKYVWKQTILRMEIRLGKEASAVRGAA